MICPHCHNTIPNGSNICPLCFSSLNGINIDENNDDVDTGERKSKKQPKNISAATTRSKGRKAKKKGRAPMIIAIGLIIILGVFVALIVRSMFTGGGLLGLGQRTETTPAPKVTVETNSLIFYGQEATPAPERVVTMAPAVNIEVTPEPEPTPEPTEKAYKTLKKNDTGEDVVMLQRALSQLGLLTSAADGIYGTGTMTAVRKFQEQNGLDVDGIAGAKTQELLFKMSPVEPIVETTVAPGEILDLPG